jgi:fumarate hydratase class II
MMQAVVAIGKIANDLRLLGSGPSGGIGEIVLPAVQPGSSIMPGKVNPSIAEMVNMVCFRVQGSAETVRAAAMGAQLELNVFMPIIAYETLFSIRILSNAAKTLAERCVSGIAANRVRIAQNLERNISLATALSPYIGYAKASEVASRAYKEGKSLKEVALRMRLLSAKELDRILDPRRQA